MKEYILKVFITGNTPNSKIAIENLKKILKDVKGIKYKLKIIDILENPKLAEQEKILATPVVEKKLPLPIRRILGDLSDKENVLVGLDLTKKKVKKNEKNP